MLGLRTADVQCGDLTVVTYPWIKYCHNC